MSKYERQIKLEGFGVEAQQRLHKAKILIVGAGGLGCPALLYLASSGVSEITVADGDRISLSNLSRQILFSESDVGFLKADVAAAFINSRYSDVNVKPVTEHLSINNIVNYISAYDLVLDCTDNFATRYLINDACRLLNKPLVFGAIFKNEGQVAVLNVAGNNGFAANYRHLFPRIPEASEIPDCSQTGVLGVLTGIIGAMMAAEAIKILAHFGQPLVNTVVHFNLVTNTYYKTTIPFKDRDQILGPSTLDELMQTDYIINCANLKTVSWQEAFAIKEKSLVKYLFVDVREEDELPEPGFDFLHMPLSLKNFQHPDLASAETVFVFCQSGIRSQIAAKEMSVIYPHLLIYSVEGGLLSLTSEKNYRHEQS